MRQVPIPTHWTRDQAAAAIEIIESILDALWQQYPYVDDDELNEEPPAWLLEAEQQDEDNVDVSAKTENQP